MEKMTELPINQKEYLKKYLGIGKAPGEKKKKKKKPSTNRVQIIDDDADNFPTHVIEDDPLIVNEDAPQIVAIIDERPPSMRVDEKTKNPLWQPIGTVDNVIHGEQKQMIKGFKIEPKSHDNKNFARPDRSPPRRKRRVSGDDYSPPRKSRGDNSPPRKSRSENSSPVKSRSDDSPMRNIVIKEERRSVSRSEDYSPPRRSQWRFDDNSPPRRNRRTDDFSPPRRSRSQSSQRKNNTPKRRKEATEERSRTPEVSPPRKQKREERSKKMEKTLDGKAAGLQNARELIEETQNFRSREENLFKSLTTDVSGQNAETVHRDRKTGKIRNLEEEEEHQRKKREEEEKSKQQYAKWGRGLAQVESREQQIKEQLHEMSKPLARYADDEDLEKYLKEKEREGDPMLAYIRKKKKKKAADAGEVSKPLFEGEFMPNRYAIRPGHRWDGVDRSSGYEKKWFEVQNEKRALQEESYKWSTEDM